MRSATTARECRRILVPSVRRNPLPLVGLALALAGFAADAHALRVPRCWVSDVGGVVEFPPSCPDGFQSRDGVLGIEDGLPAGSPLLMRFELRNLLVTARTPGGGLGGEVQDWNGDVYLHFAGTGAFTGYSRTIGLGAIGRMESGPQTPGLAQQSFPTSLDQFQAQILGDPDFDLLRITAGAGFGLPGPGHGLFTLTPSGDWSVDGHFDVTYRVDFVGAPGGPFAGMSGSTTSRMRVRAGMPEPIACPAPEIGTGTAELPPPCVQGWIGEPQTLLSVSGPPPGQPLEANLRLTTISPFASVGVGQLGGQVLSGGGVLEVSVVPHDLLGPGVPGYSVTLPVLIEFDLGPAMPGQPLQGVPARLKRLSGEILGDPVFALLRFTGGYDLGIPGSEGHVTLTHGPGGVWFVDGFFDITYRVDMVGDPSGPFAGMSSSDIASERFALGAPERLECVVGDNGTGTADFPPQCPPGDEGLIHRPAIETGLPPGAPLLGTLRIDPPIAPVVAPGGILGGEVAQCTGQVTLTLESASGPYGRKIPMPGHWQIHSAPRVPGTTPQRFATELFELEAFIVGDPDFDLLRIRGGRSYGLPSPGHATMTRTPALDWAVESFFDVSYQVEFIGAPGGPFAGMSGTTVVVDRIAAGSPTIVSAPTPALPRALALSAPAPNPARGTARLWLDLAAPGVVRVTVHDVSGRAVATLANGAFGAGRHAIAWDGRHPSGGRAPAGLYFVHARTSGGDARRIVVRLP